MINYFHIQLRPDKAIGSETVERILREKAVIGVGSTNSDANAFRNQPTIGDIVVVREGAKPVALVKIASDSYIDQNTDDDLDWFDLRRKVEILQFYRGAESFPQPRGTFSICSDLNNATSTFIINWYKRYLMENIIANCKLDAGQKQIFRDLFDKFKLDWSGYNKEEAEECLTQWKEYAEKISGNTLQLTDYTNIKTQNAKYLCNFLERQTKQFGSSRPGSSHQYMVKKNSKGDKYYIKYGPKNEVDEADEQKADEEYKHNILPLLKKIVDAKTIENIAALEKSEQFEHFEASQILRKMVVLNNGYGEILFGFFYVDRFVDNLMEYLFKDEFGENFGFFEKNNAIMIATMNLLKEGEDLLNGKSQEELRHVVSAFLWTMGNSNGLTSEKAPNVILYGPPGTGKTFTVQNSLDFLTKGDESKVCFTQFHPSFTYEDFIDGLKPTGATENGSVKFEFVNGIFKNFCIKAKNDPQNTYYFVVDEVNRANLSTVFGETLSLLEKDYRWDSNKPEENKKILKLTQNSALHTSLIKMLKAELELNKEDEEKRTQIEAKINKLIDLAFVYDEKTDEVKFAIPKNVHFIGMMNDVDKSIDTFDLALRRRFRWKEMVCDYEVIEDSFKNNQTNIEEYIDRCQNLNEFISGKKKVDGKTGLGLGKSYEFGHSYFMKVPASKTGVSKTARSNLFNDYLSPTLKEYLRGFYEEDDISKHLKDAREIFVGKN